MDARSTILGNAALFRFEVSGCAEKLNVVRFSGHESISGQYEFQLELACEDQALDFNGIMGQPAVLTLVGELQPRLIHGIVNRFEQVNEMPRYAIYHATVVPQVWRLNHRHNNRIFQQLTTQDIIKKVLETAGIASDRFRFSLSSTYEPRDYCVQYRESDWAFISRLLEEDGIFYFFEHSADMHVLVMGDNPTACKPIAPGLMGELVPFRRSTGAVTTEDSVQRFRFAEEIQPGQVSLRDFNFKRPTLAMERNSKAQKDPDLEVYDYPGEYQNPGKGSSAQGGRLAQIRLEEHQTFRTAGYGESDCERFTPGYLFTLFEHTRGDFNKRYLITRLGHQGHQPQVLDEESPGGDFSYSNHFTCISADIPYRPTRVTPKPMVRGVQTATVVGPPGEEIYPDEFGRVKVQFHWDREGENNAKSSCWIRVSQLWAGEAWGGMYIPRVGQEVIVDFIEGDPDRPIITGRVYNGGNPVPYVLPDQKTKSTIKSNSSPGGNGYNELRFEDRKGQEQLFMHAERNMDVHVKNDSLENILHDRHQTIGSQGKNGKAGDQNELVYRDKNLTVHRHSQEHIGGDLKLLVGGIDGDGNVDIVIKGTRKELVHQDSHLHVGGSFNQLVDGHLLVHTTSSHRLEASSEIHQKSPEIIIEGNSGITLMVNSNNFIQITQEGILIQGEVTHINRGDTFKFERATPDDAADATEAKPITPTPADDGSKP
ncbi:type VI secretion system Vgr family protein [Cystobacter fuscus]